MTKDVYLEARIPGWKLHSLYDSLLNYPPDGFRLRSDGLGSNSDDGSVLRSIDGHLSGIPHVNEILDSLKPGLYYAYYKTARWRQGPPTADLIYSSQHLIFDKIPWIVDLEFANALVGYGRLRSYRRFVERTLGSKFCKKIIPWTDAGAKSLKLSLDYRRFEDKIETVHLAVPPRKFSKKERDDKVRLLFVGTGNRFNLPRSFELKGGREILLAFNKLRKRYNNTELTLRSIIPPKYKDLCAQDGVRILANVLKFDQLSGEFERADIFVFPGHQTPGSAILDAMSFELPVVATDVWAMKEMVTDEETGLLTRPSRFATYFGRDYVPLWGEPAFLRSIERVDEAMVEDIVRKLSLLIEDATTRKQMGRNGRREIETGRFSILERNRRLQRIFAESLNN